MSAAKLILAGVAATLLCAAPALAGVTVYDSEAAFDAAVTGAASFTPDQDAGFGTTSYAFGPVTETAPILETYVGDYGANVRSLGAFLDPVVYSSSQSALGLELGYYIGPQTATYTIDGVTGTITVPDHRSDPNSVFIGFTGTGPITVSFATDGAEFDTLRVVSAETSAAPEPSSWALLVAGVGATGWGLRRRRPLVVAA